MTQSEQKELEQVVAECSKGDIIVAAETGKILNDGKYVDVIRTTVYHKPSQEYVTVMYREAANGYKDWLRNNVGKLIEVIHKQIARKQEQSKKSL